MAHQLSVGRILRRDWPSLWLSFFIGGLWVVAIGGYLLVAVWYPEDREGWVLSHIMGVCVLVVTALCGALLVRRVHLIRQVFSRGEVVRGQVLSLMKNSEDVASAVLAYQYQGREYRVRNVTEGAAGRGLSPGDPVDIVVDPSKPSRAFIAKLYL
jgi:hypothetical protein